MSKLVSRIEKISRGSPAPIGFGASSHTAQTPAMALIGILSENALEEATRLSSLDADGALLDSETSDKELTALAEALGSTPWGIKSAELSGDTAGGLVEKGCDFFLVDAATASVEAAKDDRADLVLSLPADAGDGFLRALEDLPIGAAFITIDGPLTLQSLIDIASMRTMFDKYLLVQVPSDLSARELEALRDVGVDAVVVDVGSASEESLKTMKQRLLELPRQRKPRSERASAVIPSGMPGGNTHPDHDEEYECLHHPLT